MKLLVVIAPPSIYHGCSTRKKFWEEKFTGNNQDLFVSVNTRNCGQNNAIVNHAVDEITPQENNKLRYGAEAHEKLNLRSMRMIYIRLTI